MAKVYDRVPESVRTLLREVAELYHGELVRAEVTFDVLYVAREDDDKSTAPVLTCGGYQALAVSRIVPVKDRAKGCADAEIVIDRDRFTDTSVERQRAILDHELQHFAVETQKGLICTDSAHRPVLSLRRHDYHFGWFESVARRHGSASMEQAQARMIFEEAGQALFPFAHA